MNYEQFYFWMKGFVEGKNSKEFEVIIQALNRVKDCECKKGKVSFPLDSDKASDLMKSFGYVKHNPDSV